MQIQIQYFLNDFLTSFFANPPCFSSFTYTGKKILAPVSNYCLSLCLFNPDPDAHIKAPLKVSNLVDCVVLANVHSLRALFSLGRGQVTRQEKALVHHISPGVTEISVCQSHCANPNCTEHREGGKKGKREICFYHTACKLLILLTAC